MLARCGMGFGGLALSQLMGTTTVQAKERTVNPLLPKQAQFPAKAKRVIFLFMQGGPSHVDTYDYKPELEKFHDKQVDFLVPRTRKVEQRTVAKNFWEFQQYGECGRWSSTLFPEVAKHVDDLCFIQSMHTEGVAHGPATLFLHTGATNLVRPSVGSWISYGLGADNENLPAFVTINPPANKR